MKLKNKLLPLVGISTACAAVTPIALTSCKNSDLIDLTKKYESKITDIPGQNSWTQDQAYETYFGVCAANPEIFIDDCYWSANYLNLKYSGSSYALPVDNEKISNVSFKQFGNVSEEPYQFWTISFEKEFDIELDTAGVTTTATTAKGTAKFVNVPVSIYYDDNTENMWNSYIDQDEDKFEYLWDEKSVESSLTVNVDIDQTKTETSSSGFEEKIHYHYSYNLVANDSSSSDQLEKILDDDYNLYTLFQYRIATFGYSHYLFNISYVKE